MRVALRKIEGVQSAEVSLNQGVAVVRLRPENRVRVGQIRDIVRTNGFTPKAAEVRVRGYVVDEKGELLLTLPQGEQVYRLDSHPTATTAITRVREFVGELVIVDGTLPESAKEAPRVHRIQVRKAEAVRP